MYMDKESVAVEEKNFKRDVMAMLVKRNIKKKVDMLTWLRDQKQKKVTANLRRVELTRQQMKWLEEMAEEEESMNTEEKSVNAS